MEAVLMFECPICEGTGGWTEYVDLEPGEGGPYTPCQNCDATGRMGIKRRLSYWFWNTVPVRFVEWYGDWRYPYE